MRNFNDGFPHSVGQAQFAPLVSDYIDARVLAANTAESHPIPDWAMYMTFSATADFYANFSGTAAIPSGDVTDGTASDLNPAARRIWGGKNRSVSLISGSACTVTMAFYA